MSKVVVIGLDGATWDLMMPLAKEGFLPNLQRLVREGCWGELESTLPPVTAPAWATFATGKNPGKTGIFDFLLPRGSLANLAPVTSKDISGKAFYEIIDDCGLSTVMVNMPLSHPPRTGQPTITCMLTQGSQFVFPPTLARTVPELAAYRLVPDFNLRAQGRLEEYARDIRELERVRFTCAQRLFGTEWDFFFLLFSGTDWIQHDLYGKLESNALPREHAAFQFLRDIDHYLGWFAEHLPQKTHLLVMSDHGFRTFKGAFLLNQWLKQQHLLQVHLAAKHRRVYSHRLEKEMADAAATQASRKNPISSTFASLGTLMADELDHLRSGDVRELIRGLNPARLGNQTAIDYSKSAAACTSPQLSGIYLNSATKFQDGIQGAQDSEATRRQIITALRDLRDPLTGEPAFAAVLEGSQAYSGDGSHLGPDIVISPNNWIIVPFVTQRSRTAVFAERKMNNHSPRGMFLSYGPGVKSNHQLRGARIQDMAPTILYLLGLPSPDDLDGRILTEILDSGVPPATSSIRPPHAQEARRIGRLLGRLKDSGTI